MKSRPAAFTRPRFSRACLRKSRCLFTRVHVPHVELSILADRFSLVGKGGGDGGGAARGRAVLFIVVVRVAHFKQPLVALAALARAERGSRGLRSPRSRSRLEITPFHPYLQGERVSRKGAVASGIASTVTNMPPKWLTRLKYRASEKDWKCR